MMIITKRTVGFSHIPTAIRKSKNFIVNAWFDSIFFIGAPIFAMIIGGVSRLLLIAIGYPPEYEIEVFGSKNSIGGLFIGVFVMAHLFIVFFRSHLNQQIFRHYPFRFVGVPIGLFLAMFYSPWIAVFVSVVAIWWDVYHSSLQTFGLGRIYDMKQKNDALIGRKLDKGLNLLFYVGPILGGATLMDHVDSFNKFEDVGDAFFTAIPAYAESNSRYLTWLSFLIGIPYLIYYFYAYYRYHQQGYKISFQKVSLLVITGATSIICWGFNSFGEAFFIMNFFHALQYFAIVWHMEGKNITTLFCMDRVPAGKWVALTFFLCLATGYGIWAETIDTDNDAAYCIAMVVSIMHFWYDGFIWSVRRGEVR